MVAKELVSPVEQYVIDFVRQLRIDKGMTQEDVANVLELSRSYVGDIENPNSRAKYNISHINALADYFDLSPRAFLPEKPVTAVKSKTVRSGTVKKKR